MQINLSDETLDHLRFHLGKRADEYTALLARVKTPKRIAEVRARLAEVRDLVAIFEEQEPAAKPDVTVTADGSVYHFALHNDRAVAFVKENFATESWQWLGAAALGIDHRFAPQVVAQLREDGFNVVVR